MDLTTPALLFSAISLLFLAYTNRFNILASRIRSLYDEHRAHPHPRLERQIRNMRIRIRLIQKMQESGALAFLCCVISITSLFLGFDLAGRVMFFVGLLCLTASLVLTIVETHISVGALQVLLDEMAEGTATQASAAPRERDPAREQVLGG